MMLIDFTVGNFLSFNEPVTLSMEQAKIDELKDSNCFDAGKRKLLKSAVVYGANSSGKSNLIKAMIFIKLYTLQNVYRDRNIHQNFRLATETDGKPLYFEIRFIQDSEIIRYGFEADSTKVFKEWLYSRPNKASGKERMMFTREFDVFDINKLNFKNSSGLKEKTKDDRLFLNVAAEFNQTNSVQILGWFFNFNIVNGLDDNNLFEFSCQTYSNPKNKDLALNFLSQFSLGFDDFDVTRTAIEEKISGQMIDAVKNVFQEGKVNFSEEVTEIATSHNKYDADGNKVGLEKLDLITNESQGTNKIFSISALLLNTLINGKIIIIDELDARLHPLLTRKIIELFHSPLNKKNAQLIFATHDTNLLSSEFFRRDQIWFTEKDQYGATDLYSLVEIKETRKDASFAKNYIQGKYGAIPFIGDFYGLGQES